MLRRATLSLSSLCHRPLARFARNEDGSLLVFGMTLFLMMVMLGGLAVDLMRYEQRRTALQQTIDRSVLAAASLTQDLEPEDVVNDYFEKAGLSQYLRDVNVYEGVNFRRVNATAEAGLTPFFTHMVGINDFEVPADSEAEQVITDVEIVLVLDVSGSMNEATGSTTKIAALRKAASDFVATVKAKDLQNRISITIVPYNAQVNLGSVLRGKFNATNLHGVPDVNCLEIPGANYNILTLSRDLAMPMAAYADTVSGTSTANSWTAPTSTNSSSGATHVSGTPFCRNTAANIVRLPSGTVATLQSQINALQAAGNTSTALGVRWGLTLLDPAMRPMFAELASEGHMPAEFANRPFDWKADQKMKVMVVMTDGDHVAHNRITTPYKTGMSPIYRSTGDGNYSIRHTSNRPSCAGTNEYWVPHLWNSGATQPCGGAWRASPHNSGSGVSQQTWEQIWVRQRVTWVSWQLYARALGTNSSGRTNWHNTTLAAMRQSYASDAQLDTWMSQSCKLAKDKGVVVYGIAFEAPAQGQAAIADCATHDPDEVAEDSGYYFNAQGLEIQSAFSAIASNISQLRLTQ